MISHNFFLKITQLLAEESKCISLHVGAVIVKDFRIISMGYNGTVASYINCREAFVQRHFISANHSSWSDAHEIHAEMNAIMFAAKNGIALEGATLYCTHEPCDHCLKNIIQTGIKKVIYINPYKKEKCKSSYRNSEFIELVQMSVN